MEIGGGRASWISVGLRGLLHSLIAWHGSLRPCQAMPPSCRRSVCPHQRYHSLLGQAVTKSQWAIDLTQASAADTRVPVASLPERIRCAIYAPGCLSFAGSNRSPLASNCGSSARTVGQGWKQLTRKSSALTGSALRGSLKFETRIAKK
jgi:hypothetical protein